MVGETIVNGIIPFKYVSILGHAFYFPGHIVEKEGEGSIKGA